MAINTVMAVSIFVVVVVVLSCFFVTVYQSWADAFRGAPELKAVEGDRKSVV